MLGTSTRKCTVFVALSLFAVTGCSVTYKAEVQSNTEWSGSFGNRTVDGSGSKTVDLPKGHPQCVVVQKQGRAGFLKVRVTAEGGFLFSPADSDWAETSAEFGVVSACSND